MHSTFNIRRFIYASYYQKPLMSQILINVLEIFLAMRMLTVPTPLDPIYVHATLDTLDMDKLAYVILISFLQCSEKSFMTREEQFYYCSFYTYNPNYSKREVIWNVLLTQIMAPEVIKYLSLNVVLQNIQLWVVTLCAWSPSDIDECSTLNICDEHASCSNTQGP